MIYSSNCVAPQEQEQKNRVSSKVFNKLFETGREVIFCAKNDERLSVTEISSSISSFGYSSEDFISGRMKWIDLLYPDDMTSFLNCIRAEKMDGQGTTVEYRILAKENNPVWVSCFMIPEVDDAGKITNFLCKITDISLTKQYKEELNTTGIKLKRTQMQLETIVKVQTDELHDTQKQLMYLNNNLPGGVIYQMLGDSVRNGWFTYLSAGFVDIFEMEVEEIMLDPAPLYMCIHLEDRRHLIKSFISANEKKVIDVEFRICTPSGKNKWIHTRSSYNISPWGVREWNGYMIDITDRKHAMQELENLHSRQDLVIKIQQIVQSTENLHLALNLSLAEIGKYTGVSRVYIFEKNIDGTTIKNTYEWCNEGIMPVIEELQALPFEIAQPWFDIFETGGYVCTSDIHTLTPDVVENLDAQGIKAIVVLPLVSGGVHFGFVGFDDCITNRDWNEGDVELLKTLSRIISNVTCRQQAEAATQLSQHTMKAVLDNINAYIFVADFDTSKILYADKTLKEMKGCEIENVECWKILRTGKSEVCQNCPRSYLRDSNNNPTGLHRWERYDKQSKRWYDHSSIAIKWIDGRLVQLEFFTDITQRKMQELELIQVKERAEESDKLKSSFLGNLSHEIRTPLNGIATLLSILSQDTELPDSIREYIGVINKNSEQLLGLINNIIDMAKIDANQMSIHPEILCINDMLDEMYTHFESVLQVRDKAHISLECIKGMNTKTYMIYADPERLRQILFNLLDNAVKFTEQGHIRFGYRVGTHLEFFVEDTGIGIPKNLLDTIFQWFRQGDIENNRRYGGNGLGLTISQSLVQLMGGVMRIESIEGSGSTFFFTIP